MATRTIVTAQPVLSCEVCSRRLLRGEHHEVFLHGGQRRTVCELCAPRATHAGWLRERDVDSGTSAEPRDRPAGSFLQRLLRGTAARESGRGTPLREERSRAAIQLDTQEVPVLTEPAAGPDALADAPGETHAHDAEAGPAELLERALLVFNSSPYPRRMRGLARSLGEPASSVRRAEHLDSAVRIVIAWELCWYRYEVDLAEEEPAVHALEQGTEISELEREERDPNAVLDDEGALSLDG